jgi:hypothetical protein
VVAVLARAFEEHLKTEAHAQQGDSRRDAPEQGVGEAALTQARHGRAEGAHAGQDERAGAADHRGAVAQAHRRAGALEPLGDARQVAHAVVDEDDLGRRHRGGLLRRAVDSS